MGVRGEVAVTEVREPVATVRVTAVCGACGGPLTHSGEILMCHPPLYPHRCERCWWSDNLPQISPWIEYVPTTTPHD